MDIRASDAERDATVDRLREAAAEGRLTLEDLTDRIEAAAGAVMRSELVPLTSDLPATTPSSSPRRCRPRIRAVGDVKRAGTWTVEAENEFRTWFGNIKLDLRQAQISAAETHIYARALFGTWSCWFPRASRSTCRPVRRSAAPSRPAPRSPGAPRIVLTGGTFFGDIKSATAGCGKSWAAGADSSKSPRLLLAHRSAPQPEGSRCGRPVRRARRTEPAVARAHLSHLLPVGPSACLEDLLLLLGSRAATDPTLAPAPGAARKQLNS